MKVPKHLTGPARHLRACQKIERAAYRRHWKRVHAEMYCGAPVTSDETREALHRAEDATGAAWEALHLLKGRGL